MSTGIPARRDDLNAPLRRIGSLASACRDIRRMGSPALDICWVALGVIDAQAESLAPWDIAAACLVATESGCRRANLLPEQFPFDGDLAGTGLVVAAPGIMDDLLEE